MDRALAETNATGTPTRPAAAHVPERKATSEPADREASASPVYRTAQDLLSLLSFSEAGHSTMDTSIAYGGSSRDL